MQPETPPYLPVNHVFVDFENVKKVDVAVLGRKNFIVHLFLGPQNKKLDVEVVEKLLEHSQAVKLVRSPKVGNNALDFVLAYHLGQAVQTEPKAYFHIVSKDEGFDSLVEFLKSRNLKVKRHSSWEGLEVGPTAKPSVLPAAPVAVPVSVPLSPPPRKSLSAGAEKLLEGLKKSAKNRPKKRTTLVSHAKSSLGKNATDAQGEAVVEELLKAGKLKIDEKGAVAYKV